MLMIIREEASKVDEVMEAVEAPMAGSMSEGSYQGEVEINCREREVSTNSLSAVMATDFLTSDFDTENSLSHVWPSQDGASVDARAMAFLSHSPPQNTPSSYGGPGFAKRGRHLGPANNTLERQSANHNWGGRRGGSGSGEDEEGNGSMTANTNEHRPIKSILSLGQEDDILSTSFSDMRMADQSNHKKCNGHDRGRQIGAEEQQQQQQDDEAQVRESNRGRKGASRLESCAALEAAGFITNEQKHKIKDLLILGEDEELHMALDEFALSRDARRIRAVITAWATNPLKKGSSKFSFRPGTLINNSSGDEAYSSSSSNPQRKRENSIARKSLEARIRENSLTGGSPFMELDSGGSLPSSFGASFLSGNRHQPLSGVSIDSDELEGVAAAAAIAASAVGGSMDTEAMFLLAPSSGTIATAASRMAAEEIDHEQDNTSDLRQNRIHSGTAAQQAHAAGISSVNTSAGSGRHRSLEWTISDDVAFQMDLDGVLDDTDGIFHQGLFDQDDAELLEATGSNGSSHPRLVLKISAEALAEDKGYEHDTSTTKKKKSSSTTKSPKEKKTKAPKTPKLSKDASNDSKATPKTASPSKATKPKKETTPKRPRKKDSGESTAKRKSPGTKTKSTKKTTAKADAEAAKNASADSQSAQSSANMNQGDSDAMVIEAVATKPEKGEETTSTKKQEKDKTPRVIPATVTGSVSSTVSVIPPLEELSETPAPVYDALINYPRAKARGARHCVMCGRAPAPDGQEDATIITEATVQNGAETAIEAPAPAQESLTAMANHQDQALASQPSTAGEGVTPVVQPEAMQQDTAQPTANTESSTVISPHVPTTAPAASPATAETTTPAAATTETNEDPPLKLPVPEPGAAPVVIPKQNKDVCRECDKATWNHATTGCYFKWCKGCKRFRNLVAFKGKIAASKCDHCRARGREGYMRRKEIPEGGEQQPATATEQPVLDAPTKDVAMDACNTAQPSADSLLSSPPIAESSAELFPNFEAAAPMTVTAEETPATTTDVIMECNPVQII